MDDTQIPGIAGDLDPARRTAEATGRHAKLVYEMNRIVRQAADALVELDSTTASFEAFKNASDQPS